MLCLNWNKLFGVLMISDCTTDFNNILSEYHDVFKDELGTLKNVQVTIPIDPSTKPKFYRAHPVPYALKTSIEHELTRLVKLGISEPIPTSQWAAPIVPVFKSDGSIHICGDYKQTVKKVASCDKYPVPNTEDILAKINDGGGGIYKVIFITNLSQAYQQLV